LDGSTRSRRGIQRLEEGIENLTISLQSYQMALNIVAYMDEDPYSLNAPSLDAVYMLLIM